MSIDYGHVRCGLAVTDSLRITANALTTVSNKELFVFLDNYLSKEQVDILVVGYPRNLKNELAVITKEIDVFIARFSEKYPKIKVELIDERFTIGDHVTVDGHVAVDVYPTGGGDVDHAALCIDHLGRGVAERRVLDRDRPAIAHDERGRGRCVEDVRTVNRERAALVRDDVLARAGAHTRRIAVHVDTRDGHRRARIVMEDGSAT